MAKKGQVDGVIISVTFLSLILVGILLLGGGGTGATGYFTMAQAPRPASPTAAPATPTPYPAPAPTATPPQYYATTPYPPATPTPYNPPVIDSNYNGNYYGYYCNGYPCPYPTAIYTGYASLKIVARAAPVSVYVDGVFRASIGYVGNYYTLNGLSAGYHTVYATGSGCSQTQSVYVNANYQTYLEVCAGGSYGGGARYGDGTYYLYRGDSVTSSGNARFELASVYDSGFSLPGIPQVTFSITQSNGQTATSALSVGGEYYYAGGSIKVTGVDTTGNGPLVGVVVSSYGNLQPSPTGSRQLSGRITSSYDGRAIQNAVIMIVDSYNPSAYMNAKVAGYDGFYLMPYVPDGTYDITVMAEGFYDRNYYSVRISSDYYQNYQLDPSWGPSPTPTPGYLPDLYAESYEIGTYTTTGSSAYYAPGAAYYQPCSNGVCKYPAYKLRVRNIGSAFAPSFDVSINPNMIQSHGATYYFVNATPPFGGLSPNQFVDIFAYAIPGAGASTITAAAIIDTNNNIAESSEANNQVSFSISVNTYPTFSRAEFSEEARRSGSYGLKISDDDAARSYGAFQIVDLSYYEPVMPSDSYSFSGYARLLYGGPFYVRLEYLDSNRQVVASHDQRLYSSNGFSFFSISRAPPAFAKYAAVSVFATQAAAGTLSYSDDFFLRKDVYYSGTQLLFDPGFESPSQAASRTGFYYSDAPLRTWVLVNP